MTQTRLRDPKTGRFISKHQNNMRSSYEEYAAESKIRHRLPLAPKPSMKELYLQESSRPKPRPYLMAKAKRFLSTENNVHGARTRGWSIMAPRGPKEREELYNSCGKECYLGEIKRGPKGGFHAGFPICARCNNGVCNCKPVAAGIVAAGIRARQWGYSGIAKHVEQLKKEYHIGKEIPPNLQPHLHRMSRMSTRKGKR
jgi:hypothetical protein